MNHSPQPLPTAVAPQVLHPSPHQVAPENVHQQQPQAAPEDFAFAISGGGGGGANDLLLSEDLLDIDSEEEDRYQQEPSQNTLAKAAVAINGKTSTSGLLSLTQACSSRAEGRKEDDVTADMPQAKVVLRLGIFAAIEHRLDQESQERWPLKSLPQY